MNPTPSPSPIDVIIHASPAADWQVWAAFAPLIAAVVAGLIAGAALWQKRRADNRSEWWRRAQWALDASITSGSQAEMGQKAIELLGRSKLATKEELALLKIGTEDPLEAADQARRAEAGDHVGVSDAAQAELTTVDAGDNPGDNGGDKNDDTDR